MMDDETLCKLRSALKSSGKGTEGVREGIADRYRRSRGVRCRVTDTRLEC